MLPLYHGKLIHNKPVVCGYIFEIHQPDMVSRDGTVSPLIFHYHAIPQHPVEGTIRLHERRRGNTKNFF